MGLTAAASGFVVLLSLQGIQGWYGQYDWGVTYSPTRICAVEGSTVTMQSTYRYPSTVNGLYTTVEKTFWFTKMNGGEYLDVTADSDYSGHVHNYCYGKTCTLTLRDLRKTDSATYKFRFITNKKGGFTGETGVTLSVTDLQVSRSYAASSWTELKCHIGCVPTYNSYIWYKNGQKIQGRTFSNHYSDYNDPNSYSCALGGYEDFPSPSVCVRGQTCNGVAYTDTSICAPEGSSVNISCVYNSYNYQDKTTFWFRFHQSQSPSDLREDSQYVHRVHVLETKRGRSTLRITDLTHTDSAQYHFKLQTGSFERDSSPGTTLTVTALQLQVSTGRVYPSGRFYLELTCRSSCGPTAPLSYVWFKNGEKMFRVEKSSYKGIFEPEDILSCALKGHEDFRSPPVYAPKRPSASVSPSAEIVEGGSVTLNCSSDANPAAKYTWYKKDLNLNPKRLSEEPQLVLSSIQSTDSGEYFCAVENELGKKTSESIFIDVKYAPKISSASVKPSGEIVEGSSVTLSCSSDANPAANFTWYKKNQTLLQGAKGSYHFTPINSEDRGIYHCKSENQFGRINSTSLRIDVQYAPKLPSVSVSPSAELMEGSSVTLSCSSDANPAANFTWYKENEESPKASGQIFSITDAKAEHSGSYYCVAENRRGRRNNTSHLTVVTGSMSSVAVGSITAVFLAVIFLAAFLLIRRKSSSKPTTEPRERPDNKAQVSAPEQRTPAKQQDDIYYASVRFSKNQEDTLYSNVRLAQPHRHKEEEEEEEEEDGVEYSIVNFKSASATAESEPREAVEDSSALYSTVIKKPRV